MAEKITYKERYAEEICELESYIELLDSIRQNTQDLREVNEALKGVGNETNSYGERIDGGERGGKIYALLDKKYLIIELLGTQYVEKDAKRKKIEDALYSLDKKHREILKRKFFKKQGMQRIIIEMFLSETSGYRLLEEALENYRKLGENGSLFAL